MYTKCSYRLICNSNYTLELVLSQHRFCEKEPTTMVQQTVLDRFLISRTNGSKSIFDKSKKLLKIYSETCSSLSIAVHTAAGLRTQEVLHIVLVHSFVFHSAARYHGLLSVRNPPIRINAYSNSPVNVKRVGSISSRTIHRIIVNVHLHSSTRWLYIFFILLPAAVQLT